MATVTPKALQRLARRRDQAQTGTYWRHASPTQRQAWLRRIEPVLRAQHGIAADAVYRHGAWQPAAQLDLFSTTERDSEGDCDE